MNLVPQSWDGSDTLPSAQKILTHRNTLLEKYHPGARLVPVSQEAVAQFQARMALDRPTWRCVIELVPGHGPRLYKGSDPHNYISNR